MISAAAGGVHAQPHLRTCAIPAETDACVPQDGKHSLQQALDEVIGADDTLVATTPMTYRRDLHRGSGGDLRPGVPADARQREFPLRPREDRVATLLLPHFVAEVEHRSSALIVFDHVAGSDLYRLCQAPSMFNPALDVIAIAGRGFDEHVPFGARGVDAMSMFARTAPRRRSAGSPGAFPGHTDLPQSTDQ